MASVVGEASSSFPPSTSTPPPPPRRSCTYDVFLSFSGKDTRNGITSHLNAALERRGIKTFIDDNDLETGEDISSELLKAIEESMFAITVFSPNYASSSWCLEELHKIVECSKNMGLSIVPVFYGVEPYHVRRQKGSFGEAFKTHEDRFGQNSEKVRRWRDALVQVASVSGFDFKDKQEAKLVERIAEHIQKKLIKRRPSSTKNLVGINSRVEEVISRLDIGLNDGVRSIGIWGMGGIGKTTIAKAVYDAIQGYFEVSCFLYNVREACEEKKIVDLQKKLLTRANISVNTSDDEHDLQEKIQTFLCNRKVLLVLDDVSNVIELKNLAEKQDWFGLGSRIIITTRNTQVLTIYDVHGIYEVQGLVNGDSFDLFCLKAFKPKKPVTIEYLDLSREVVEYSGGLPLALEVWGSHLKGRPIDAWHDAIAEIKRTPFKEIHNTLIISYNGLDDKKKNIFLDIASFFKGKKRDYVTEILKSCGYNNANFDIAILIERSLVMIKEESEVLEMHDLLQDLGRSIVIQESKDNPGKRSRIWSSEDIDLVLEKNKGSKDIQVQGIALTRVHRSVKAFSNMTQLKLLKIFSTRGPHDLSSLPTSLKVLHCWGCRFKTLLRTDQQYDLVDIRLEFGYIENLWHGKKFLGKLKHLRLRCCSGLKQTPDVSKVPMLQTLVLERCGGLTKVHPSVVQHKSLTLLDLTCCLDLKALPGKLEMSSLRELILDKCSYFENLPEFGECMKSLSRLSLDDTAIKELPTSLGCLVGLEDLSLRNWDKCLSFVANALKSKKIDINALQSVQSPKIVSAGYYGNLHRLRTLNLSNCSFLSEKSFPPNFFHFPSLMDLDLSQTDFVSIPISIHGLPKLKCLKLNNCNKLRCLPELPPSIRELEAFNCDSLDISEFNILSKVGGVFESPSQDPGQVLLEMVIPGSEIPSWFVHQEDGNSISIPCDYPRNERLGIALCFRITFACPIKKELGYALVIRNGINRFNINRTIPINEPCKDDHLYIICLTNDYFSDGFHQGTCFELSILEGKSTKVSMTSAAHWVSTEDIEDLKKSEIERPKKTKMFGLN